MAFEGLTDKLQNVFKNLRGKGRLSEEDVKLALKEVKMALLEADVNFKIEVAPKDNFEMPEYYWQNSEGVIVAQSTVLTGSFKNGLKDLKEYKIVFLNSGEEDITRLVDFNLVAIQANE